MVRSASGKFWIEFLVMPVKNFAFFTYKILLKIYFNEMIVTIRIIVMQINKDTITPTTIPTPLPRPLEVPLSAAGSVSVISNHSKGDHKKYNTKQYVHITSMHKLTCL